VNRTCVVAVLVLACLTARASAQAQGNQRPAFRSTIDIVSLNVTVIDGANRYLTDLEESDFSVFEDGVKQDIIFFTRRPQPIAMSLLLDSSASMDNKLATLQVAASNFVHRLRPNDLAQVIDFDSRVTIRQAFTSSQTELEAAIRSVLLPWMIAVRASM
jgi:VWFA-related protein